MQYNRHHPCFSGGDVIFYVVSNLDLASSVKMHSVFVCKVHMTLCNHQHESSMCTWLSPSSPFPWNFISVRLLKSSENSEPPSLWMNGMGTSVDSSNLSHYSIEFWAINRLDPHCTKIIIIVQLIEQGGGGRRGHHAPGLCHST